MSLMANMHTDSMGNIIIFMKGGIDYENTIHIKDQLLQLTKENPACDITIDLNQVDFVGSSGIGLFVDIIKSINKNKDRIKLSNVRSEFLKVFKLYAQDAMTSLIDQFDNDETEYLSQNFANRKKTFQN